MKRLISTSAIVLTITTVLILSSTVTAVGPRQNGRPAAGLLKP